MSNGMINPKGLRLSTINTDTSGGIPKQHLNQLQENMIKPKCLKHCKNERPLYSVIGFGKANLKKDGLLLGVSSPFHPFQKNDYIIQNVSRFDKTHLLKANNLKKKMTDFKRERALAIIL